MTERYHLIKQKNQIDAIIVSEFIRDLKGMAGERR